MWLCPHFSSFLHCNVDGETTFVLCRNQFIAWQDCMLLIDYLDVVYVIFGWCWWHLISQSYETTHQHKLHQDKLKSLKKLSLSTQQIVSLQHLDCFTLEPVCDSVNLHYQNQFKDHEKFCNNRTKILLVLWII